jgi:hypothetical protein
MKQMIKKIKSSLFGRKVEPRKPRRKSRAQSMVEFAVLLPVLLILFSGMLEFGFVLNTYLSLIDATRQTARVYSTKSPFELETQPDGSIKKLENPDFYLPVAEDVIATLNSNSYKILVDPDLDDVLISVVGVDSTTTPGTIKIIRHPYPDTPNSYYSRFNNGNVSRYLDSDISDLMVKDGSTALNAGLLIIEMYYSYEGTLKLPWVTMFASDADPMMLYSSSIMPMGPVKPSRPTLTPVP